MPGGVKTPPAREYGPGSWGVRLRRPLRRRGPRSPPPAECGCRRLAAPLRLRCLAAGSRVARRAPASSHGCRVSPCRGPAAQRRAGATLRIATPLGAEAGSGGRPDSSSSPAWPSRASRRGETRGLAGGRRRRGPAPSPSQKAGPSGGRPPPPHHHSGAGEPALPHQPEVTSAGEWRRFDGPWPRRCRGGIGWPLPRARREGGRWSPRSGVRLDRGVQASRSAGIPV